MRAVGQERRSPAQPPRHPSGQKIAGDGTWGEGRPPFADTGPISASTAPDKRGSPVPTIGIVGAPGETPTPSAAPLPDKRTGARPGPMAGGPGTPGPVEGGGPREIELQEDKRSGSTRGAMPGGSGAKKAAEGGSRAPAESGDPCASTPAIHAEGSRQAKGAPAEPPRSSGAEVACHKGKVHSAAAGRSDTRTVASAAAPDGAFTVLTGEPAKSPPQGPAGGFAGAPEKSSGYGTERTNVGSCAPKGPSMTVRMPPSHPATRAGPRTRPVPAIPAFGARAALPTAKRDGAGVRAARGLGVSQVHLSGPMLRPGPRVLRTD